MAAQRCGGFFDGFWPDGGGGFDGGGGNRHGAGGGAVHQTRLRNDANHGGGRELGHRRLATLAQRGDDLPHLRFILLWRGGQAGIGVETVRTGAGGAHSRPEKSPGD